MVFPNYIWAINGNINLKQKIEMAILKSVHVMRGPGTNANLPYPTSGIETIVGETLSYKAITGDIPGVNSVIRVRLANGRNLIRTNVYYVNETVAQLDALIIAG